MSNREEILNKAMSAVCGDRDHNYGGPESSFGCIAQMWSAYYSYYVGREVVFTPDNVASMMALLKLARIAKSPDHEDSWVDLAGYAACGGEVGTTPPAVSSKRYPDGFEEFLNICERDAFYKRLDKLSTAPVKEEGANG